MVILCIVDDAILHNGHLRAIGVEDHQPLRAR